MLNVLIFHRILIETSNIYLCIFMCIYFFNLKHLFTKYFETVSVAPVIDKIKTRKLLWQLFSLLFFKSQPLQQYLIS